MIAWFLACGTVVLLLIFFALWRRERALRLDAEERERWWSGIASHIYEENETPGWDVYVTLDQSRFGGGKKIMN